MMNNVENGVIIKNQMNHETLKTICYNGLGIALYVALSLCLQVPVFENYYLCLGYIVMLVYCYSFGPVSGALIGGVGCFLHCIMINGMRGMPGWMLGNIFIGFTLGYLFKLTKKMSNRVLSNILTVVMIVVVTTIAILGIKSITECLLYAQPFAVRTANNIYAFVADVVVLIVALPMCPLLDTVLLKLNDK